MGEFLDPSEFMISITATGEEAIELVKSGSFSAIILDVMLPGMDGFGTLDQIRRISDVPVLMLTTRGAMSDRVTGLDMGADDYLPKPFQPEELQARLRSIIRRARSRGGSMGHITVDDLELDEQGRRVKRCGEEIELTGAEFALLQLLLSKPSTVHHRETLIRKVFDRPPTMFDRSIDSLVSNLRRKLGPAPDGHDRIRSVRGIGYAYAMDGRKEDEH